MKSKNAFSMVVQVKVGENSKRYVTTALKHYHRENTEETVSHFTFHFSPYNI